MSKKCKVQENRVRIVLEGEQQYKEEMQKITYATKELREEIEQLNIDLEKEVELLKRIKMIEFLSYLF